MKFKFAVILSVLLHFSLFTIAVYMPDIGFSKKGETVYYVDFIQLPGGSGDGAPGGGVQLKQAADVQKSVKDLTVKKETVESDTRLRYPDQDKEKSKKEEPKKKAPPKKKEPEEELISVVRKDKRNSAESPIVTDRSPIQIGSGDSTIRIGTGSGTGSGSGYGSGTGTGTGYGGTFPYSYYIDTLKSKISSSWYSSMISPGLRGKFVSVVYFRIMRSGSITGLKLEKGSGIESLDLSAMRAVENSAPFPPLPYDFAYSYLGVHFEFEWEK